MSLSNLLSSIKLAKHTRRRRQIWKSSEIKVVIIGTN
jgi:hypothetical protein